MVTALRKIQIGKETTPGTEVDATTRLWLTGVLKDDREVRFDEEYAGYLSGLGKTHIPFLAGSIAMEGIATFEQLPYILNAGVEGVSGSQDGAGSDYIYTYSFPTTAVKTPHYYTIEAGNDVQEEQMLYCFVSEFTLSGAVDETLKIAATWQGRQVDTGSFTAGVSPPTVEDILFNLGRLYIDDSGGTIGSTEKSNTLISAELSVVSGFKGQRAADGQKYFSYVYQARPEISLKLTFIHNSSAVSEISKWRSEAVRLLRLKWEGSSVSTPGTTYSKKTLIVDMAGKWEAFETLDEQEGNDVISGTFRPFYSSADALFAQIIVVNELASLP